MNVYRNYSFILRYAINMVMKLCNEKTIVKNSIKTYKHFKTGRIGYLNVYVYASVFCRRTQDPFATADILVT